MRAGADQLEPAGGLGVPGDELLDDVILIAKAAGQEILRVYADGCEAQHKQDGSPVTEADHRAQDVICAGLERLTPSIPIVAEENGRSEQGRPDTAQFWLVDPLDGTKEFLSRNGEFTVNIALIDGEAPVLGVILAPALGRLFACTASAALLDDGGGRRAIRAREMPDQGPTVVSSRSHGDAEALRRCLGERPVAASTCAGSSLKFCLVAAGEADLYPRLGRTMEWDTAAGDAILRAAGGTVSDLAGEPLRYGKPGFENPHFVAQGRGAAWWTEPGP